MRDRNVKRLVWAVYAIPAIPLFIYTSANLASGSWRIVICSIMFVVFAGLMWFTDYAVSRLRDGLAGGLFADSQDDFTDKAGGTVEISDPAADDFLRAMSAAAVGQSRK
jgi:hypothetical protein